MTDVLYCNDCGSRRLRGSPDEGFFCLDCGRHARGDFETTEAFGNARDHQDGFWSSFDPRLDGEGGRASDFGPQASAGKNPDPDPDPEVRGPRSVPASFLSDPHSHLRCACCFELAARCRRIIDLEGRQRCCPGCRCAQPTEN